jgi:hypothetical protein
MNDNPNSPGQTPGVQPGLAPAGLLDRVLMELMARRAGTEMTASKHKRNGAMVEAGGWECRAAGLAEAIAVVQMFNDATRPNDKSSGAPNPGRPSGEGPKR